MAALQAMTAAAPASEAALLAMVYADTPAHLHAVALRSLRAHLLKLQADSRAVQLAGDVWQFLAAGA